MFSFPLLLLHVSFLEYSRTQAVSLHNHTSLLIILFARNILQNGGFT